MAYKLVNLRNGEMLQTKSHEPPAIFRKIKIVRVLTSDEVLIESASGEGKPIQAKWWIGYVNGKHYKKI